MAKVGPGDIVYDLGSGDGRIPIAAVKNFGAARATGIDIDPQRIKEAEENRKQSGVGDRVRFMNQDLFQTNISEATVVTLYLLPSLNVKLIPKLNKELKPGTRIVSHQFDMGDWAPEQTLEVEGRRVYFWTIPKPLTARTRRPREKAASHRVDAWAGRRVIRTGRPVAQSARLTPARSLAGLRFDSRVSAVVRAHNGGTRLDPSALSSLRHCRRGRRTRPSASR